MKNKIEAPLLNMEIPAILQSIGVEQQLPDLVVYDSVKYASEFIRKRAFRSTHFSLIFIVDGELDLKVNLVSYHLTSGNVIIIPPGAIREMDWENKNLHIVSLIFTPVFLRESGILGKYFDIANFVKEGLVPYRKIEPLDHVMLVEVMGIINRLLERKALYNSDLEIIRNLCKTILLKVQQYFDDMEIDKDISSTIIYRFLKLLAEHYVAHREVTFYSSELHIHEKYLSQLLKKKTGKTARQFIIEMVVLESKVLLDERSLSIKQISEMMNFENPFHFSRFFKQYVGIPPQAYRKSQKTK
ncbi:helix-turn-helix domain-containing protein [Sphingobacterium sp. ML3W]|uniref:helix-turn-helix domain-containing protein n=1 Tax=Sphingobacterium sp. ML3W TaxID=1538644 RepID=UPI0006914DD9|nr:AraC family transcriptional regulator [Sphingobacterium sp. ML3W]